MRRKTHHSHHSYHTHIHKIYNSLTLNTVNNQPHMSTSRASLVHVHMIQACITAHTVSSATDVTTMTDTARTIQLTARRSRRTTELLTAIQLQLTCTPDVHYRVQRTAAVAGHVTARLTAVRVVGGSRHWSCSLELRVVAVVLAIARVHEPQQTKEQQRRYHTHYYANYRTSRQATSA